MAVFSLKNDKNSEIVGLLATPLLYQSGHVTKSDVPKWYVPK